MNDLVGRDHKLPANKAKIHKAKLNKAKEGEIDPPKTRTKQRKLHTDKTKLNKVKLHTGELNQPGGINQVQGGVY